MRRAKFVLVFFLWFEASALYANPLQQAIDDAAEGSIIKLERGVYHGPITINKAITLTNDSGDAIIRGAADGSVVLITANHASITNMIIEGSGDSHQTIDACVTVKDAHTVKVVGNTMRDCLFGINFENTHRSSIENNTISSKDFSSGLRGDGIRLWYSHSNTIRANNTSNVRDNVFWYSSANRIEDNIGKGSRYSLHFMYADRNMVHRNTYQDNSVGIFLMYSHGGVISKNTLINSSGPFGIGLGMKEVSDCLVEGNHLMYNARGFYLDQSPYQPGTLNRFIENNLLYNTVAIQLHGTLIGSLYERNTFKGNIDDIANDTPESRLDLNSWHMNTWDTYEGFDRNQDGFGDTPYEKYAYADRLWNHRPAVRFFFASPVIGVLNFLSRLLPFSEPELLAVDDRPVVKVRNEL